MREFLAGVQLRQIGAPGGYRTMAHHPAAWRTEGHAKRLASPLRWKTSFGRMTGPSGAAYRSPSSLTMLLTAFVSRRFCR